MSVYRDNNPRRAQAKWRELGGAVTAKPATDEDIYTHPSIDRPLRVKATRNHAAKIVLTRINQLMKRAA